MPPATEPIPWQIIEALQAKLALPDGGANYFYDFNVVKVGEDIFQARLFPAVTIGIGDIGRIFEEKEGRILWGENLKWNLSVFCVVEGHLDSAKRLARLLHDVHRALSTDYGRLGGLALGTIVTGAAMYPPEEGDTRSWLEIGVEVHFRTKDTTMLEVT